MVYMVRHLCIAKPTDVIWYEHTILLFMRYEWYLRVISLILAEWSRIALAIMVNIGSGNGLLPGDTKPLLESILTCRQRNLHILNHSHISQEIMT